MLRLNELAATAVTTIRESMERWGKGKLQDDESTLIHALQIVIDLSGGLRWIEKKQPGILCPLVAPMRAGEETSFNWEQYKSELCVRYHDVDVWLIPSIGEELMANAVTE